MKGVGGLRQTHHQWEVLAVVVVVAVMVLGGERQVHHRWDVLGDDGGTSVVGGSLGMVVCKTVNLVLT